MDKLSTVPEIGYSGQFRRTPDSSDPAVNHAIGMFDLLRIVRVGD